MTWYTPEEGKEKVQYSANFQGESWCNIVGEGVFGNQSSNVVYVQAGGFAASKDSLTAPINTYCGIHSVDDPYWNVSLDSVVMVTKVGCQEDHPVRVRCHSSLYYSTGQSPNVAATSDYEQTVSGQGEVYWLTPKDSKVKYSATFQGESSCYEVGHPVFENKGSRQVYVKVPG
ncbi:hypothetical protein D5S17_09350 [Pseudonocardiaceae bacterium YIM PH 21723]|nr:hypothetical protein D5S17_09350 [Pseudonocardiaceae bacterium YIM PH 21723]